MDVSGDQKLVFAILLVILPFLIFCLLTLWTKVVAKRKAEIINTRLNEELLKLV